MTTQIFRNIGADGAWHGSSRKVARAIAADGSFGGAPWSLAGAVGTRVVRLPSGPMGLAAAQDLVFTASEMFGAGEALDCGPAEHSAVYGAVRWFSRSGVASDCVCSMLVNDIVMGSFTLKAGAVPLKGSAVLPGGGIRITQGDVPSTMLPDPADSQLNDLKVTWGSFP